MELIPKAKPVKIRIKSGGEEHSSLGSLKRNFNISDINPLLDGRLARWLRQQGESALADATSKFDSDRLNTLQGKLDFLEIFFENIYTTGDSVKDMFELVKYWLKTPSYKNNGENLFHEVVTDSADASVLDVVKLLFEQREVLEYDGIDWFSIFLHWTTKKDNGEIEGDSEVLYILGKMLWDKHQSDNKPSEDLTGIADDTGLELILKSARSGFEKANLFIFEYNKRQAEYGTKEPQKTRQTTSSVKRFDGVNATELKRQIDIFWDTPEKDVLFKMITSVDINAKEKEIARFIRHCHFLTSYASSSWDSVLQKAFIYFFSDDKKVKSEDFLKQEKWFIIGLIYKLKGYPSKAQNAFTEAGNYPPAQYMLSDRQQIKGCNLKSMIFPDQITFVVKHLFDYE